MSAEIYLGFCNTLSSFLIFECWKSIKFCCYIVWTWWFLLEGFGNCIKKLYWKIVKFSYGSKCHGGTLSVKVVFFFATLAAYRRQVWQIKPSNLYISELVMICGPQKYETMNSINKLHKFHGIIGIYRWNLWNLWLHNGIKLHISKRFQKCKGFMVFCVKLACNKLSKLKK